MIDETGISNNKSFDEWWGTKYYLLVDATIDPYYVSFDTKIWNCIHSCLHCCEITTPFFVNTKIRSCIGAWRWNSWWEIITNRIGIPTIRVFLVWSMMAMVSTKVVSQRQCKVYRWWWQSCCETQVLEIFIEELLIWINEIQGCKNCSQGNQKR